MSDILSTLDSRNLALLTIIDLSAAFDTLDHHILLQHLTTTYSVNSTVLRCLECYLSNRTQSVQQGRFRSKPSSVTRDVPQVHKARSSSRSCFYSTPLISLDWFIHTASASISMQITHRCMAFAVMTVQKFFKILSPPVLTTYMLG